MRRTSRHFLPATLLAAAAVFLTGCFTLESTFTISDHGTVDLEVVSLIDTERLTEIADLFGEDVSEFGDLSGSDLLAELSEGEDPCGDLVGTLVGYDVATREISEGSKVGVGCTVSDVPFDDLTGLGDDSSLSIEQDDTGTRFELILEGTDELTGGGDDLTDLLGIDADELFVLRFSASAPGSLSDNNATSTDGATATWLLTSDAPFVSDGTATLTASWTPGSSGSGSSAWIIAVIIAALVLIGLIVLLIIKRSKGKSSDSPETDAAPPASPPSPSSPPAGPPSAPKTPAGGQTDAPLTPPLAPSPPAPMPPPSLD